MENENKRQFKLIAANSQFCIIPLFSNYFYSKRSIVNYRIRIMAYGLLAGLIISIIAQIERIKGY